MNRKKTLAPVFTIIIFLLLFLVFAVFWINRTFSSRMAEERKNQLNALTAQVSDTLFDALSFDQSYVFSAKQILSQGSYESTEDIISAAGEIRDTLGIDSGSILMLTDADGYCYDADGRHGIFGDLDQMAGTADSGIFISDSITYDGVYWAFYEKLAQPVETKSDGVSILYVALLCPVESMDGYYISDSYGNVGETYILHENGTRMYDNIKETDTIEVYNVYKALRSAEDGDSFDSVLEALQRDGVAGGVYVKDKEKYCYSLAWHEETQMVVLYLIPADRVASDTADMVSDMTRISVYFFLLLILLLGTLVYVATKTNNDKKLSAQKEQSMHELEKMNKRLTKMNESLENANKAAQSALAVAESANRAKSSFLSNMSHDIRTPLNAILGFQKLLDTSVNDPEKVKEYSGKIKLAGDHLLALINDILDMSRIESGKTTLNMVSFDLEHLVDELRVLMSTQTREKGQEFLVENRAGSMILTGDRARLVQILTNLLSNAIKYTPKGGTIKFLTECISAEGSKISTLRFVVKDNGVGMDQDFQKRIFEPFAREESTLINGIQGTGLGLSITKNLIDLMGGIIMVESRKGEGSTFTVEISFQTANAVDEVKPDTEGTEPELEGVLNGCRFLLAEDTDINAEILTSLLDMEGATCDVAHNGKEAAECFEASEPGMYTAILMDVQMPIMDGYEATKRIRRSNHPEAETIPIAALTANAFAEDVQRALEAGMNTHIAKPVDMKKLREFIAAIK